MTNFLKILFFNLVIGVGLLFVPFDGWAQTLISNFYDWSAFSDGKGKDKACYIASVPKKEFGNYKSRGRTYVLVTHRPARKEFNVFELRAGYIFRKNSEVIVSIDGQSYKLFTDGGSAWAFDNLDKPISRMMRRGRLMVVTGFSERGTKTKDTYSLRGYMAAYKSIGKACGVK